MSQRRTTSLSTIYSISFSRLLRAKLIFLREDNSFGFPSRFARCVNFSLPDLLIPTSLITFNEDCGEYSTEEEVVGRVATFSSKKSRDLLFLKTKF